MTELARRKKVEKHLATLDYGDDAGAGAAKTKDDIKVPYLLLLQSLSPQITGEPDPEKQIEGAEVGQLVDSVTNRLLGDEIVFVPAEHETCWVEWVPRKQGGGFVGRHDLGSEIGMAAEKTNDYPALSPDGNHLFKTTYLWGIRVTKKATYPMIVAFDRSKREAWKAFNNDRNVIKVGPKEDIEPPIYAWKLRITSKRAINNAGQAYKNLKLQGVNGTLEESLLLPDDALYLEGKRIAEMFRAGKLVAADEDSRVGSGGDPQADPNCPF